MKTILYNPIFINPQAYYVFPRLTRWLRPDDSYKEPANYIGQIEVTIIAYGEIGYTEYFEHTNYIDFTNFSNSYVRISLFTRLGSCVLGEWKIGTMEGDRPYIEPEVLASLKAVVIVGDKTNQDKDRDIVANLVDASNPFIISNAAYKLNSGYGLYEDFSIYKSPNKNVVITDTKIKAIGELNAVWVAYSQSSINQYKVKITGIPNGGRIGYIYRLGGVGKEFYIYKDGIYNIPASDADDGLTGYLLNNIYNDWSKLTIEQIPSYQGAFVTDGVDDLITSTKTVQDMLGGSNECTIVSMMWNLTSDKYTYNNQIRPYESGYIRSEFVSSSGGKLSISGYTISNINYNANVVQSSVANVDSILGDKADFNKNASDGKLDGKFSVEGYLLNNGGSSEQSQVAWYWTVIANKVLTTDQINQVIAYYNLDRCVEPTVLYDVKRQGLSNDTPNSDWYLKDYSGNGYDMTLYNYAKTPESGINEDGGLQSDGVDDYGKVTGLPIYKDYTVVADYVRTFAKENVRDAPILSKSQVAGDGAFLFNYLNVNSAISSYSFGTNNVLTNVSDSERKIYYQSKYVNGGKSINSGTGTDYDSMWLGTYRDDSQIFFTGAIYSLTTFPYSMSEFLIERQLKKHKLGTLYPDMVEWRPIYTSNVNDYTITKATYFDETGQHDLALGNHYPIGTRFRIYAKPSGAADEVTFIKVNGVELTYDYIDSNYGYAFEGTLSSKSPQKIDILIDEYIRYEDIVQPYPAIVTLKQDGKDITWGDKLKVGDEVTFVTHTNLLPNLYTVSGAMYYNGKFMYGNTPITVAKSMTFTTVHNYIKSNEPKCILSPSRLRIPNSSYKILGYIPDISGHGNHGKINNSAYSGMSGANGYVENFTTWGVYNGAILTDNTIKTNSNFNPANSWVAYKGANTILNSFSVNITGIPEGGILNFRVNADTFIKLSNGRNDLSFDNIQTTVSSGFRIANGLNLDWSNLVIEQVGEYEGAYCLDGVDDFITIPTTVGGKQVLMKVNWQRYNGLLYDQRLPSSSFAILPTAKDDNVNDGLAYRARNITGTTYLDGIKNEYVLTYTLKNITHNITATNSSTNTGKPVIGASNKSTADFFNKMSLYDFVLFDEIDSDEEILTLNEYVGIEGNTDDLFN